MERVDEDEADLAAKCCWNGFLLGGLVMLLLLLFTGALSFGSKPCLTPSKPLLNYDSFLNPPKSQLKINGEIRVHFSSPPESTVATPSSKMSHFEECHNPCSMKIAESIPTGLSFNSTINHSKTHEEWLDLINNAEFLIEISSLYWNLNSSDYPTAGPGRQVFEALANAGRRGVFVQIAQSAPTSISDNADSAWLQKEYLAEVRTLDFPRYLGGGVLHTKFIIVDGKSFYLGSANMDWKSLTEVKELGIVVRDCECVASDLQKIFEVYWDLGQEGATVPSEWSDRYSSPYNSENPNPVMFNSAKSEVYFSGSPLPLNPPNREADLDTILRLINEAHRSICVSVMDFIPANIYSNRRYWPDLDNALRAAAYRGVAVNMLVSKWSHSRREELGYLMSLVDVTLAVKGSIQIKWFIVPATEEQKRIGHARVNHNKYMVTERDGYIGTSNWVGDYFLNTAGVGIVVSSKDSQSVQEQLQAVFDRDWDSEYAQPLH